MGNINNQLKKETKTNKHRWVRYSNPRNGRIQITACKDCGTMLMGALSSRPCSPDQTENIIETKGWTISQNSIDPAF